jgi:hypothetical protein
MIFMRAAGHEEVSKWPNRVLATMVQLDAKFFGFFESEWANAERGVEGDGPKRVRFQT